jgi:hypothetical protein
MAPPPKHSARYYKFWGTAFVIVTAILIGGAIIANAFDGEPDLPGGADEHYTVAEKLSAIDTGGDTSAEAAEFQDILNCIRASGIEGAETETQIADTLVAAWNEMGSDEGELLELGQALCSA